MPRFNRPQPAFLIAVCVHACATSGTRPGSATPELVHGCCTYGAHFTDKADRNHVAKVAKTLGRDEWQFAKIGRKKSLRG